jgi:hypothetical protein
MAWCKRMLSVTTPLGCHVVAPIDYSSPIPLNFWDCFVFCCSLELVNLIRSIVAKSPQGTVFLSIAHLSPVFWTQFECFEWMLLLATYLNVVCGWWAFIQGVLMTPSHPALAWLPNAVNVWGAIGSQLMCKVSGALKNVQREKRAHTFEHSTWYWYNTQAAEVRFLLNLWVNVTSGAGSLIVKPSKWRSDVKGGFLGKNRVVFYDYYKSCDQVSVGLRGS